jgi:hypothetical protein
VALVPLGVVTETWYVVPDFIWLGAHADRFPSVPPDSTDAVKITLFALDRTTLTNVAPVNWTPVTSISLVDAHDELADSPTVATDGTGAPNAQLTTENVVPHVELPCGEQLDAAIVLGKSSKSTTTWRNGFA